MTPRRSDAIDWAAGRVAWATPPFDAIRSVLETIPDAEWPSHAVLNQLVAERRLTNARGQALRFLPPDAAEPGDGHYELDIARRGVIATRRNWHDFFNACQWLSIPQTKALISETHARALEVGGEAERRQRGRLRDRLTLFDEGGMIVVSPDATLLAAVRAFRWKELFVERRAEVRTTMRFLLVGHAMLENALVPYVGMTAKAVLLQHALPAPGDDAAWCRTIDAATAQILADDTAMPLAPLPFLGIPGWDARNEDAAFYDNADYFRPGHARAAHRADSAPDAIRVV